LAGGSDLDAAVNTPARHEAEPVARRTQKRMIAGSGGVLTPLDGKTGLLTGLLTGILGWKCPVALSQTCYGSKSLKVILMDSNFGGHPVLKPLVTL
jgi:hypothetical protein